MNEPDETREPAARLLASQRFAVLSTQSETGPHCSLVAYWAAGDLSHVVFATLRDTRKFRYLVRHPRVALLFDDRSNRDVDVEQATAITAPGTARELTDDAERAQALVAYVARHPQLADFANSPGCALVRVDIDSLQVVTRFQPGSSHTQG